MSIRNWFDAIRNNKYLIGIWALLTFLLLFRLESIPPLWLDEGWIMTVARNFVELGHYGRLVNGIPYTETIINIGIPVIAPIILSFYLFGVGILQARITIVLFTLAALLVFYRFVGRLYNPKISLVSLLVILILPFNFDMNPIFIGRQALGELPALFYLVSGYLFFLLSERKRWAISVAVIFWTLAILSKFQIMPFLIFGLMVPAIVMLIKRNYTQAILLGFGVVFTILLVLMFGKWTPLFNNHLSKQSLSSLIWAIVLIPDLPSRGKLLLFNLPYIMPVILCLLYATIKIIRTEWRLSNLDHVIGIKISMISLVSSWIVWFVTFSVGWTRHLTIPMFLGSMFVALAIHDMTRGFASLSHPRRGKLTINNGNYSIFISSVLLIAVIVAWILIDLAMAGQYLMRSDKSVVEVANFINSDSPANSLVETTDFELFVFLNRKYHFPPDEAQLELLERKSLGKHAENIYNPLDVDPNYIIIGPFSRFLGIYKEIVKSDQFALIRRFKNYDIYENVRVR